MTTPARFPGHARHGRHRTGDRRQDAQRGSRRGRQGLPRARWPAGTWKTRHRLARLAGADGRVAIAFSDIEDSTVLNDQLGDAEWVKLLASHDKLSVRRWTRAGGLIVKSQGDGFMIAFADAGDAVRGALDLRPRSKSATVACASVRSRCASASTSGRRSSATATCSDVTSPWPRGWRPRPWAARSSSATRFTTPLPTKPTCSLVEAQTVQLKGLPGTTGSGRSPARHLSPEPPGRPARAVRERALARPRSPLARPASGRARRRARRHRAGRRCCW